MNRPYFAFGILLLLLALATLAVSSTTHSTSAQRIPTREPNEAHRRHPGGPALVIILPEATAAAYRGWNVPTRVELAETVPANEPEIPDRRSQQTYYDDCGELSVSPQSAAAPAPVPAELPNATDDMNVDEILDIYAEYGRSLPQRHASRWMSRWLRQIQTTARGLGNWTAWQAERWAFAWLWKPGSAAADSARLPAINWSDYTNLMDCGVASRPTNPGEIPRPTTIHLAEQPVQSGAWMRHSAVWSLNRLTRIFDTLARELQQPGMIASFPLPAGLLRSGQCGSE
jgi:hypothetical protein